jgi:outer membrane protein
MTLRSRSVPIALAKYSKLVAVLALSLGSVNSAMAQEASKIGYVRTERILSESSLAKAANQRMEQEFSKREKELQDLGNRLKTMAEKFDKDAAVLSETDRSKRQRELAELDKDFARRKREIQEDFAQRKNEELAVVQDRAAKAIKQVAEAEKYDIVIQDVLFASPRVDITDKVLKVLNK